VNPKAWEQEPTLACFLVRESAKRREEGERGVRVNPENYIVEDVEGYAWTRRQHLTMKMPNRESLPGAWAHIETPRERTEQERPIKIKISIIHNFYLTPYTLSTTKN